jgi:hypothetical protein
MRKQAEYNQYEIQRLEDKEMRKGGTHHIDHFSKQHNEVPRMTEDESDEEEEEAPKSAFEQILPVAAVGAAGAVIGYRNRKTIRKGVKAVKSGVKAAKAGVRAGVRGVATRIRARFGH